MRELQKFREVIKSAFPNLKDLQRILDENKCSDWWSNINTSQDDDNFLYDLIKKIESECNIPNFLDILLQNKLNNKNLWKFYFKYLFDNYSTDKGSFIELSKILKNFTRSEIDKISTNAEPFLQEILNKNQEYKNNNLILLLLKIENFQLVIDSCLEILPSWIHIYCNEDIEYINNNNNGLTSIPKLFCILQILIEKYPDRKDCKSLISNFVEKLREKIDDEEIKKQMENCLKPVETKEIPSTRYPDIINAYLLILVEPPKKGKSCLNAFLELPNKDIRPLDLKSNSSMKGCTVLFKKNDKQTQISIFEFITESKKILKEEQKPYNLTIEFFLPIEYFHYDIEHLQIPKSRMDTTSIGEEYNLIYRSYDRLIEIEEWNRLQKAWERVRDILKKNNQQEFPMNIIQADPYFEYLEQIDFTEWKCLVNRLEERKIGLKLNCCLPTLDINRRNVFKGIVYSGIPIAIWIRKINQDEIREFKEILINVNLDCFSEPKNLLNRIRDKRKQVYQKQETIREQYLGYNLGILYESDRWGSAIPDELYIPLTE
ncbi:hypothetical protein [Aulosira sp. FACHB-615]|uniref:VMAP-C domain-containing protein n=1 Tax=Aulosira sp. FACHB-615 TaxID=2692777 RepID=UPI001689EC5E|nr:hypothetical protein [Aulosira sp. FACHB-615]MBD2491693.1 hypothetical protein [Aulosira sp. FACHB-615]